MIDAVVLEEDSRNDFVLSITFVALHESFVSTTAVVEKGDCDDDFGNDCNVPFSDNDDEDVWLVGSSSVLLLLLLSCLGEGAADEKNR